GELGPFLHGRRAGRRADEGPRLGDTPLAARHRVEDEGCVGRRRHARRRGRSLGRLAPPEGVRRLPAHRPPLHGRRLPQADARGSGHPGSAHLHRLPGPAGHHFPHPGRARGTPGRLSLRRLGRICLLDDRAHRRIADVLRHWPLARCPLRAKAREPTRVAADRLHRRGGRRDHLRRHLRDPGASEGHDVLPVRGEHHSVLGLRRRVHDRASAAHLGALEAGRPGRVGRLPGAVPAHGGRPARRAADVLLPGPAHRVAARQGRARLGWPGRIGQRAQETRLRQRPARRDFLKMTTRVLAGAPALSTRWPIPAHAGGAAGGASMKAAYDPAGKFEVKVSEVEFRRNASGRTLMARIYQPQGTGPFPALLDLHGGAWNNKDRTANEPMDRAGGAGGVLVVANDLTLPPDAPDPPSVQDGNYGVRWLKSKAAEWNGEAAGLGVLGSSSGGHVAELLGMRPRDARYNAISLPAPGVDAAVAYVATRSPISDTYARYQQAE